MQHLRHARMLAPTDDTSWTRHHSVSLKNSSAGIISASSPETNFSSAAQSCVDASNALARSGRAARTLHQSETPSVVSRLSTLERRDAADEFALGDGLLGAHHLADDVEMVIYRDVGVDFDP